MRHSTITLAIALLLVPGCIEPQDHGGRPDGSTADAGPLDLSDAGPLDLLDAGPLRDGGPPVVEQELPPFIGISSYSSSYVNTELIDGALVPRLVPRNSVRISGYSSRGTFMLLPPEGTLGPCGLYPPLGSSTWPPSTGTEAAQAPVPPGAVSATINGAPLALEVIGGSLQASGDWAPGTRIVISIAVPGSPTIVRTFTVRAPLEYREPALRLSIDALEGTYTPGDDLNVGWDVTLDPSTSELVDITGGSAGALRCAISHGDGGVSLTGAQVRSLLGPDDVGLSINIWASSATEEMVGDLLVTTHQIYSAPSAVLIFP